MDYFLIGQQIRKYRKAQGLSQEQLAERIGISLTHMSHIETGNTKLSLPVFVEIARVLEVATDDLLAAAPGVRETSYYELEQLLNSCTTRQLRTLTEVMRAVKIALDKHIDCAECADCASCVK